MGLRTRVRYRGEGSDMARLAIIDASGRLLRRLHNGALAGGLSIWEWDGRNEDGRRVASGVYYARMEAAGKSRTVRLVVVR
jgi:flagellar hook assembly protein FlgD